MSNTLSALTQELTVTSDALSVIAMSFAAAMEDGLAGKASSLKMLPAHLGRPTGRERGSYLALDFGGTNVRVLLVELKGNGLYTVEQQLATPLKDDGGAFDYTTSQTRAEALFDFLAALVARLISPSAVYQLGHTFSFPCRQVSINQAVLIHWTKEIATSGVAGCDVGRLMDDALERQGIANVKTAVILNDTVGTLLTSAYQDTTTDIGSICGTGHNTCYLEPHPPVGTQPMIINMESGNFNLLPLTRYDKLLDAASQRPGEQLLEKMAAGRYLGELVRLIAVSALDVRLPPYSLTAEDIGAFLADNTSGLSMVEQRLAKRFNLPTSYHDRLFLQSAAELIVRRAARLVAATYTGVIWHLDQEIARTHTIAIDGSLYEKMPGYARHLKSAIDEILGSKATQINVRLTKDGSGIGAAVAAAVAAKE